MPWNPDGTRKRSNLYKKSSGFKMKSPLKHSPYAPPHKKGEKIAHGNTPEAHGKKAEDYYKGEKGKVVPGKWDETIGVRG